MRKLALAAAVSANFIDQFRPIRGDRTVEDAVVEVVSPAAHGSMGDEAMVVATHDLLTANGYLPHILTPGQASDWATAEGPGHLASLDARRTLGGLLSSDTSTSPAFGIVIGADSIDGAYGARGISQRISYLNRIVRAGAKAALVNFSFRKDPPRGALRLLRMLSPQVTLHARDKESAKRASEALRRDVFATPDVAMFLQPSPANDLPRQGGSLEGAVAVVVNGHLADLDFGTRPELHRYFVNIVAGLRRDGLRPIVMAHDLRANPGDPALARSVAADTGSPVLLPSSAREAKALLGDVHLCVTARMHAAVAALSSGTPTIGIDYVDKFRGQFDWYGQAERVVSARVSGADSVVAATLGMAAVEHKIRQQLGTAVQALSQYGPSWIPTRGATAL